MEAWPRYKSVADAFRRFGKPGDPAKGAQRFHRVVASGQNLVRIALMSHIKDQPVPPGIEYPVNGHDEFHRPQTGGKVSAGTGDRIDQPRPQQGADLAPLRCRSGR